MVVIFRLRRSPRTMRTGNPAALTAAASSPKDRSPAAKRARSRISRRKTWGVCADQSPSRATSSMATPASSARRTVSASGRPATALPSARAISTQRAKSDGGANGRAESWIAITSASWAAASAAHVECVLVSPPATILAVGARDRTMSSIAARGRSGRITTTMRPNTPDASAAASDHASTGCPPRSASTLSIPARVELPEARMAQTAPTLSIDGTRPAGLGGLALRLGEDHSPADGLEDAHHGHGELGTDVPRAVLDDHHRAVLEVADALSLLLSLLDDPNGDLLARQHDRAHGLREIVHVQNGDALELRDAIEPVVVGHDRYAERARERDELRVGARARRIVVGELDLDGRFLLHLREHLEAAAATFAA